jgi:hypothetical protein
MIMSTSPMLRLWSYTAACVRSETASHRATATYVPQMEDSGSAAQEKEGQFRKVDGGPDD